ncbi:MAG: DUF5069 domain-containing protein [Verrucomicrobiota bacterium]
MDHYAFPTRFRALHDEAVRRYGTGHRTVEGLLQPADEAWLAANGLSPQNLFDYAEDFANYGEPGPELALAIELVRRDYFWNAQGGRPSGRVIDADQLPAKADAVRGVAWLPRLIPKARAKLRGELPASLMFSCGGDRRLFRERGILPAEFLSLVWREPSDEKVVDWVLGRGTGK